VLSVLIDTGVLLDYLVGDKRAQRVIQAHAHRAISVVTWLELMAAGPAAKLNAARDFLRTFERLSISESIADEALRLMQDRPGLPLHRALTWATARVNQINFVTNDADHLLKSDAGVTMAYRRAASER